MARSTAGFLTAFLLVCGFLVLVPELDLHTSALFYRAGQGFFLADWPPFRLLRDGLPLFVCVLVGAGVLLLVATGLGRRRIFGLDHRAAAFLLIALALGPGLLVNVVFKDHWGRARPTQIVQFGGTQKFTPAFVPSGQCDRNCSFPAGDPAVGFFLVSLAFLLPEPRQRRIGIGLSLGLGALLGLERIAQGGHFLSDVIASGFFIYAVSWLCYQTIMVRDGLAEAGRLLCRPSSTLWRFLLFTVLAATLFFLAFRFIDLPLARAVHEINPTLHRVFAAITHLGEGVYYLLLTALLAVGFLMGSRHAPSRAEARRRLAQAWRASFVFACVALPGLLADILKPVFGRARPVLFFRDGLYGFTWHGARANYWSFPSGHSVTVAAVAAAMTLIYPRLLPLYAGVALLVMASRIVIEAHYLSDVIAGAYLGLAGTWGLWLVYARAGIALAPTLTDNP